MSIKSEIQKDFLKMQIKVEIMEIINETSNYEELLTKLKQWVNKK